MYFGIGSNIRPEEHIKKCADLLRQEWTGSEFSNVYQTAALHEEDQDDFLNAVVRLETELLYDAVYKAAKTIEAALGKDVPYPKGPRTIDIDLLLYDTESVEHDDLIIPHPRMHERRFVLDPLLDIIEIEARHPTLNEFYFSLLDKTRNQECKYTQIVL